MPTLSKERIQSNKWIRRHAESIEGAVLSVGSGSDQDNAGSRYRNYFKNAAVYHTSDISLRAQVDLRLDVRDMSTIKDESYDCVFGSGILEHIDDIFAAMREINRVTKTGGVLLTGVPLGYRIHRAPQDFWRLTIHGLRYLLERHGFKIVEVETIRGAYGKDFPAVYWVEASKVKPVNKA